MASAIRGQAQTSAAIQGQTVKFADRGLGCSRRLHARTARALFAAAAFRSTRSLQPPPSGARALRAAAFGVRSLHPAAFRRARFLQLPRSGACASSRRLLARALFAATAFGRACAVSRGLRARVLSSRRLRARTVFAAACSGVRVPSRPFGLPSRRLRSCVVFAAAFGRTCAVSRRMRAPVPPPSRARTLAAAAFGRARALSQIHVRSASKVHVGFGLRCAWVRCHLRCEL